MSLLRTCYLCGKPVGVHRRMSVFCSDRCEQRYRVLNGPEGPGAAAGPTPGKRPAGRAARSHPEAPRLP